MTSSRALSAYFIQGTPPDDCTHQKDGLIPSTQRLLPDLKDAQANKGDGWPWMVSHSQCSVWRLA